MQSHRNPFTILSEMVALPTFFGYTDSEPFDERNSMMTSDSIIFAGVEVFSGRKPQGKGWKLDPTYKGDGVRWIEVTGRVEVRDGVAFLRASKVTLVSAPKNPE